MAPRTTSDARLPAARSAVERAATLAAIAAMRSSALPKPAPSWVWRSGIISAAVSQCPASLPCRRCPTWSAAVASLPDTGGCPGFCPYYDECSEVFVFIDDTRGPAFQLEGRTSPLKERRDQITLHTRLSGYVERQ